MSNTLNRFIFNTYGKIKKMKTKKLIIILSVLVSTLIIISIASCGKDEEKTNQPPTCEITSPSSGQEFTKGETVTISVEAQDDDGSITEVRFFIDNVGKGSATSFPFNYNWNTDNENLGNHTLKATSIDNSGESTSDEINVNIVESGGEVPVANFIASPTSGNSPLIVNFTDQSTNNSTNWQWDFGDGSTSTQQNPSHTYNTEGTYTVSLTVTNSYGNDSEVKTNYISVSGGGGGDGEPCPGMASFTYHGQTYNTVLIDDQCWMKENLNYETGDSWCYDDDPANCDVYGRLYSWYTIMNGEQSSNSVPSGVQGICPDGWHIPSGIEWIHLANYVGGSDIAGGVLKEEGTTHWTDPNVGATNQYGFTALPSGGRSASTGEYNQLGEAASFWTCTEYTSGYENSKFKRIENHNSDLFHTATYRGHGLSLRCVKD